MKPKNKTYDLIDYKGKADFIQDKNRYDESGDFIVGEITHEEALRQASQRIEESRYYGICAYIGDDKELKKIYER